MKIGIYIKLALESIQKNKRLYYPFIITSILMVMVYYIINYLELSEAVSEIHGGSSFATILGIGTPVLAIFSCIFLFYTYSFLIRRRKKEFGLYNILGMSRANIALILLIETFFIAVVSIVVGLIFGVVFSKLAEMGLINIIHGQADFNLLVSVESLINTLEVFSVIFALIYLNTLRQVWFSSSLSLLKSENSGEKPPKGNWFLGILGIALLIGAYYISITMDDPLEALTWFFLAVIMVIIGTYCLLISGSVLICRLLQKNTSFYYKPNHFVAVSSMAYRMKRNGAGLASICILATMVLVIISSTACLYFGFEDTLLRRYPKDINLNFRISEEEGFNIQNTQALKEKVDSILLEKGVNPKEAYSFRTFSTPGVLNDKNYITTDYQVINNLSSLSDFYQIYFVPLSDYNEMMGTNETLEPGQAFLYSNRTDFTPENLTIENNGSVEIVKNLDVFPSMGTMEMDIASSLILIVPDAEARYSQFKGASESLIVPASEPWFQMIYYFNTGLDEQSQIQLNNELNTIFEDEALREEFFIESTTFESQSREKDEYFSIFGGLFYLGLVLSAVFILAAILIIYYKQLTEGYEDQSRFNIMKKVGMTSRDIRKSINSQLLLVFFIPLLLAVCHMAFAFPIVQKLLLMFNLNNITLFIVTTVISSIIFAICYMIVYYLTSNAYFQIVNQISEE